MERTILKLMWKSKTSFIKKLNILKLKDIKLTMLSFQYDLYLS